MFRIGNACLSPTFRVLLTAVVTSGQGKKGISLINFMSAVLGVSAKVRHGVF